MKTPLEQIDVKCCICNDTINAKEANESCLHYTDDGEGIIFPKDGMTKSQIETLKTMSLTCELCREEQYK